ncbi:Uncharacterised protein [Streptococcus suis]|nr:Uncharacterised protein [Streptococcus suis]CYU38207.1 Uncharacterised protein [Streptococcus suis]CYU43351.1 Uncharacterised protein [Streptococcus suis]CYV47753.1 Uncharacterised protein [Streptococcus suis]CYV81253.1 Uncharacterised protein [Streptococcus suis]
MNMIRHQMSFDNFYAFITTQMSEYFSQTTSILIIDDFSSILRCEDNVVEHNHFICDKLCAFCAILFSSRFTIGLNTFIVSRLEFFGITFVAHPHSGWFICHAPYGARRTKSHINTISNGGTSLLISI